MAKKAPKRKAKKVAPKKRAPRLASSPLTNRPATVLRNEKGHLLPGSVLNPNGRPKSSRHRLTESFVKALADDFELHGIKAIEAVRDEKPGEYLRVIAAVLPKQLDSGEDEDGNAVGVALITR